MGLHSLVTGWFGQKHPGPRGAKLVGEGRDWCGLCGDQGLQLVVEQVKRDKRVEDLTETMSTIYYHIQDTDFDKIKSFENTLQRLVKMTTECAYFIASYKKKVFARRTVESALLGVDDIIANFEENFSQLRIEFLMGSTLQSTHKVLLVLDKVRDIETLLHLQPLPLIQNTGWIRTRTELTSEQEKAFDGLTIWAQNPDEQLIAVLVGKSCEEASLIAHKLCERFHDQERLGSAIFFPATTGTTELSCKCLISTIARELAALHPTFAESIAETLAKSPSLALGSTDLGRQFEDLLIHPLQSLTVIGPVLIVVDGLDRCPDHLKFVETLSAPHIIGKIPRNVRFLLAVGPESQPLYPLICSAGSSLRIWHAGGAFLSHLIMNVAWRYISKELQEPQLLDQLQDIEARMAPVYSRAELEIPPRPDPTITPTSAFLLSEIRRVVTKGKHAAFLNPLLNQARQCVPPELMPHFESYACFISTQASRWNHPFHILFLEFKDAVDPEISFWVQEIANTYHLKGIPPDIRKSLPKETSDYPKALPFLVLRYLNMTLKPNICRFEEITTLNEDIKNLDARLTEHVPAALGVLSGCWSEWVAPHLQALHDDHRKVALTEVRTFLSSHLLSWIELISLLGCVDAGLKQLQLLESVLSQMVQETSTDTNDLKFLHSAVSDSIRFMLYFGTPIWDGGLFVHRLAFFAPTSTFIHRAYAPENVVKTGLDTNWPYKFSVQGDVVRSKVGQRSNDPILTSLRGNSIKLWSLETGAHLRTFELPDSSIHSRLNKFLALPGKNHFAFLHGHASSICYTADETSLAIRVQEGHLYFMDLGTSEIRTYPSFFPCQEHAYGILEISPNNRHIATCASSSSKTSRHNSSISMAVVEVYDTDGQVMITLEHSHSELFFLSQIIWSKDQFLIITIVRFWDANSLFYLWDGETSDYRKLDMGVGGSADFSDDGEVVILTLKTEIRLINCSTFEVVISIPLNIPNPKWQMVLGHGLVMTSLRGGLVFHDIAAKSKSESPHGFGSDIRPQAYRENVFQSCE
ncbi:hypothetical protein BDN72DRAFT_505463 [Pluteus cervinus]|uniref:Uncharacterized protein n=1 Tax=Pluteus cervinus TaxID=181527 RepID=A0ACD3AYI8_9AGAR|nr:hypothetical protein BDN72DRAFT_505463 [Pluteus cervinus]